MMYTIQPGDTLGAIALRFYGCVSRHQMLWRHNRAVLEAEQEKGEARRLRRGPDWIYPGTEIELP